MNKTDLISAIASETEITKVETKKVVDAFISVVSKTLKSGERVMIPGLGSFKVCQRPKRKGRNPRTGEPIVIKAKNVVKFNPASALECKVK